MIIIDIHLKINTMEAILFKPNILTLFKAKRKKYN